jgi:hypothetical protein
MSKIILDLQGGTGAWSKYYREAGGYYVINVTLPDYDILKTEIRLQEKYNIIFKGVKVEPLKIKDIYGILASPVCTMFSLARTRAKIPRDFRQGMKLVIASLNIIWECRYDHKLAFWCLENPMGILRQFLGKPVFTFNPYNFGDPYTKKTDLWGYFNIPKKNPVKPIFVTDSRGRKRYSPIHFSAGNSQKSKMLRSITPLGFAKAFFEANK